MPPTTDTRFASAHAPGRPLRILAVGHCYIEPLPRRKWRVLSELAPETDIVVVTPSTWPDTYRRVVSAPEQDDRLRFVPLTTVFTGYGSRYLYVSPALVSLMRQFQPDVIHVDHEPWSMVYAQLTLLRRVLAPSCKQVVFSWFNTPKTVLFPWSPVHRVCLEATDLLVVGNDGAAQLHRQHGYRGRIEQLPQVGVDLDVFHPGEGDAVLRDRFGLADEFVVGFVGQLRTEKGLDTLLDALDTIRERRWRALVVGSGPMRDALDRRVAELGLGDRVTLTGYVERHEIPRYLRCMSVLAVPSLWEEQFGHVLVEAMACGTPVVASHVGGIPGVVADAGILVPRGDQAALGRALATLMDEPALSAEYTRRGLARVRERYSDEALARRLRDLYHAVIATKSPAVMARTHLD